jgi:outer membrane receptor protein involved in Fe transport
MQYRHVGMACAIVGFSAASPSVYAAEGDSDPSALSEVVVTGTRLVKNGDEMPTPVTVVSTAELQLTTPSTIPDGLNKLPALALSRTSANLNNPSDNFTGNFLNLRGLGIQRNLVLLDGHRLPPSSYTGAVDVNTMPELMVERVEIVTGGASAVYGSDAVSGVINYVLDKNLEGFKGNAQYGISGDSDAKSYRAGMAFGSQLFGGRGHFSASVAHFEQDGISDKADRPNGALSYAVAGNGTQADPYRLITNARNGVFGFNGSVLSGPAAGQQFVAPGVLGAFNHGTNEGGTLESGGDGFYGKGSSITADQSTNQVFGRISYDVSDTVNVYAQGSYARSENRNNFYPLLLFTANGPPIVAISTDNPFLTPATQAALSDPLFIFGKTLDGPQWGVQSKTDAWSAATGLTAKLGNYNLDLYYSHANTTVKNDFTGDLVYGRLYAALDAVDQGQATTGTPNGNIVCRASLTNPAYSGCIPFNAFGASVQSQADSLNWMMGSNYNKPKFALDDVEASVAGPVFDNWAGAVQVAASANFRHLAMDVTAGFPAGTLADCSGIIPFNCNQGVTPYISNQITPVSASQSVYEGAVEADIPLLADKTLAKALNMNLSARYTHYSTSGSVESWKAGLDWKLTDGVRLRATRSRDIRAPSLFDLFQPLTNSGSGYQDIHTGFNGIVQMQQGGNADLVPEKANTFTAGVVLRPSSVEGLGFAIDYYNIKISNAISNIDGRLASIQRLCEDSNGTSSFCSLYVRPLPFSDRTLANSPTFVKIVQLNASEITLWGIDGEANYRFPVGSGRMTLRGLVNYQPHYDAILAPGFPALDLAGAASTQATGGAPKVRLTMLADYSTTSWSFSLQERWRNSLKWDTNPTVIYALPKVHSVAYTDVTVARRFGAESRVEAFLSVQNLFDKAPPLYLTNGTSGTPNFSFPATTGDDVIGRYMTAGVKLKF